MPPALHVVQLNAVYDPTVRDPEQLLARYPTLTGWAHAVQEAGAAVTVVQRFATDAQLARNSVSYVFASDAGPPFPGAGWHSATLVARVVGLEPDVIHVNGLMFPRLLAALRSAVRPAVVIVAQDHAGYAPPRGTLRRRLWRAGFEAIDACSFTADDQADPWIAAGLLRGQRVLAIVESSTMLAMQPREAARATTGVEASPAILWIGRLDSNKDPLTVLDGLEAAFERAAGARAWMVYQTSTLEDPVRRRISGSPTLASRVVLVGPVPHERIAAYLSAADIFVSGSHREGSGYALIEAMACGAIPVVTDIPSFRAIAGDCGLRWPPGDGSGCAAALVRAAECDVEGVRARVRWRFERELSWRAIATRTLGLYADLRARRASGTAGTSG